ncbi:MAG TPA: Gfo/Idh/MocA family oxidoreductase [Feifaniaceae bacterium]|nr:Gfo/Idh/MocA family oxidoreductase [Feifaniaceae bacterium]
MLNLGVIGTGWITDSFVQGALATGRYRVCAVYSRTLEAAEDFGKKYGAERYAEDLDTFFGLADMDAVYIASPNAFHYGQSKKAVLAKKHVIVEKSAFSNSRETEHILSLARENGVFVFEAARHIHERNFPVLKEQLKRIGEIRGANLTYMKYSPRYDLVLKGEHTNIFSLEYSAGALYDLGVYPVYTAVALFGKPVACHYFCTKVKTGADGIGVIVFRYDGFDVVMQTGKIADSFLPSEIYGSEGTIILASMNDISSIRVFDRAVKTTVEVAKEKENHWMLGEANAFADIMLRPDAPDSRKRYAELETLMRDVHAVMTELRRQAGIVFPADKME